VLEETNDIGFAAVAVRDGFGVAPGVWFRLMIGGITGHRDFAHATGILVRPDDSTKVADAIVRVFIDHGDRTDRNKARLKYVIDRMGLEQVLALTEEKLGRKLDRVPNEALLPRPACDRQAHIGVHPQKQADRHWIGVVLPVGKMTSDQMRALAALAGELGDGDIRLTVWQNLLISGVASENVQPAQEKIAALGLSTSTNSIRAGLVACTGNVGCKFAASDTKRHAEDIARWCESRVTLDGPVNIHLTGCHNSCAQHYIGDIGLLACKVATSEEGDTVEGYHVHVGGGFGANAALAREIFADVKAHDVPALVERMLKTYMARRSSPDESFQAFTLRHEVDALRQLFAEGGAQ
jgi:ferredoxin-nitrite reductase